MKKNLFFLFFILVNTKVVYSQIIAANTASGLIISNPVINFSVTTFANDSRTFDIDCDGIADMSVELHKGPTAIDAPNVAYLHILNPLFQVCADTANMQPRHVNYFNFGDTIICPANTNWYNDANMQLGNYGCMDCPGPFSATDLFLGYKNSTTLQIGWIKISFSLIDGGSGVVPITLSVPEILSPCITTSIAIMPSTGSGVATCGVFTYNYIIYPPSCTDACDGSILISNVTGGTPGYNYLWSTPAPQMGPTASGLCNGTNGFTISDVAGNTCTANFYIPNPVPITFSLNTTNVSCYGLANGSVCCANLMGGTSPYSFIWTSFGGIMSCANNVLAGNYGFCVTDANGCMVCISATVNEPSPLILSPLSYTNVSCYGGNDGSICGIASGGTTPYFYSWSNGNISPCNNNLTANTFTFSATDANGCVAYSVAVVSQPSPIQVNESITQASCVSCCDGNLQLQINGGMSAYAINYLPTTPSCPGTYSYVVTDANGCNYTDSVLISYPTSIAKHDFETMFDVFPNPSKGNFEIRNFSSEISSIKIIDVTGKCVFTKIMQSANQELLINSNIADGIYFLQITDTGSNKEFIKKIVIQK